MEIHGNNPGGKINEGLELGDNRKSKSIGGLTPYSQGLYGLWRLGRLRVQRGDVSDSWDCILSANTQVYHFNFCVLTLLIFFFLQGFTEIERILKIYKYHHLPN